MVVGIVASEDETTLLFKALADATRRDIVKRTMRRDYSVSALARCYTMSFAAVQKHVAILERAGFITKHTQGREHLVRSNTDTVRTAQRLLRQLENLWTDRIDRFGEVLSESDPGEEP